MYSTEYIRVQDGDCLGHIYIRTAWSVRSVRAGESYFQPKIKHNQSVGELLREEHKIEGIYLCANGILKILKRIYYHVRTNELSSLSFYFFFFRENWYTV